MAECYLGFTCVGVAAHGWVVALPSPCPECIPVLTPPPPAELAYYPRGCRAARRHLRLRRSQPCSGRCQSPKRRSHFSSSTKAGRRRRSSTSRGRRSMRRRRQASCAASSSRGCCRHWSGSSSRGWSGAWAAAGAVWACRAQSMQGICSLFAFQLPPWLAGCMDPAGCNTGGRHRRWWVGAEEGEQFWNACLVSELQSRRVRMCLWTLRSHSTPPAAVGPGASRQHPGLLPVASLTHLQRAKAWGTSVTAQQGQLSSDAASRWKCWGVVGMRASPPQSAFRHRPEGPSS